MISHFLGHPFRVTIGTIKFLCAFHLLQSHGIQLSSTIGPSMMPTFAVDGDWIAADMSHARNRKGALRVGDVVLYRIPLDDGNGVKRLVGMPGDYVSVGTPGERGADKMIQVPKGHCWIIGDNLSVSRDSRHFGPLPLALIQGKVVAKILPWAEKGWITNNMNPIDD